MNVNGVPNVYKCHICSSAFPRNFKIYADYQKHMTKHKREKRFSCDICQAQFTMKRNLTYVFFAVQPRIEKQIYFIYFCFAAAIWIHTCRISIDICVRTAERHFINCSHLRRTLCTSTPVNVHLNVMFAIIVSDSPFSLAMSFVSTHCFSSNAFPMKRFTNWPI